MVPAGVVLQKVLRICVVRVEVVPDGYVQLGDRGKTLPLERHGQEHGSLRPNVGGARQACHLLSFLLHGGVLKLQVCHSSLATHRALSRLIASIPGARRVVDNATEAPPGSMSVRRCSREAKAAYAASCRRMALPLARAKPWRSPP